MNLRVIATYLFLNFLNCILETVGDGCVFPSHKTPREELQAYKMLAPLIGKREKIKDSDGEYQYDVGICTDAVDDPVFAKVGVVQTELKNGNTKKHIIGRYNDTRIMSGTDWILLEYLDGEKYGSHCGKEPKKASIMITCDPNAPDMGAITILEENRDKTQDCYYLFEVISKDICAKSSGSVLSIGSIVVIVFFTVLALYLIMGFLYQRCVLGAKGMEQIPNYGFWKDFGNLQADGCDLICRSRQGGSRTYKGIGDDQLEEVEERDDHLLPM